MIRIYNFGKYKEGLTKEEIKVYLRERLNEKKFFNVYKECPKNIIKKFNKVAGVNTMAFVDGQVLMYRHDVERFANVVLENKPTYFD